MSIWDNEKALKEAEERRGVLRAKGKRLAFDCLNLKCHGERGSCSKGHSLSKSQDGSVDMRIILNGITPNACRDCKEFSCDED